MRSTRWAGHEDVDARGALSAVTSRSGPNMHTGPLIAPAGDLQRSRHKCGRLRRVGEITVAGKGLKYMTSNIEIFSEFKIK